jgi:hypothetical protein
MAIHSHQEVDLEALIFSFRLNIKLTNIYIYRERETHTHTLWEPAIKYSIY